MLEIERILGGSVRNQPVAHGSQFPAQKVGVRKPGQALADDGPHLPHGGRIPAQHPGAGQGQQTMGLRPSRGALGRPGRGVQRPVVGQHRQGHRIVEIVAGAGAAAQGGG